MFINRGGILYKITYSVYQFDQLEKGESYVAYFF